MPTSPSPPPPPPPPPPPKSSSSTASESSLPKSSLGTISSPPPPPPPPPKSSSSTTAQSSPLTLSEATTSSPPPPTLGTRQQVALENGSASLSNGNTVSSRTSTRNSDESFPTGSQAPVSPLPVSSSVSSFLSALISAYQKDNCGFYEDPILRGQQMNNESPKGNDKAEICEDDTQLSTISNERKLEDARSTGETISDFFSKLWRHAQVKPEVLRTAKSAEFHGMPRWTDYQMWFEIRPRPRSRWFFCCGSCSRPLVLAEDTTLLPVSYFDHPANTILWCHEVPNVRLIPERAVYLVRYVVQHAYINQQFTVCRCNRYYIVGELSRYSQSAEADDMDRQIGRHFLYVDRVIRLQL